ncbi:MBL fold metallo-hydrolase [Rheinheimera sp.]|jgi:glyoxylase-like metal-dependent hydrolase (beta-lactamase superfamily II)|uniref:MBL fold metallo-hydrolase n=1 Tax=Rheinheimera sp. TaxID=1869214 RepID=UPI0026230944|nr:MBL fold metallo-hydrolase [Rheinheimera sp.]MCA1930569.1 MBL fold metallo-hydrolase [Rheinheimera sp.]
MKKISVLLALLLSTTVVAQDKVQVSSIELAKHLYMIKGAGGNIAAVVGPDGALVVDSQYEHVAPQIKAELQSKQAGVQVKTLVNTHFHGDHVNGNAALASGAQIIAHSNVLTRLKADTKFPRSGLPTETFTGEKQLSINGVAIKLVTMPVSHTDGDLVVWFKDANVLHTGDLFFADRFPFIDLDSGGSVSGYINNVKLLLSQIDEKTKLIPGHGDLMDKAGLERFLIMMQQTLAEVSALKAQGKTEDQIVAQGLSAQWKSWSWHFITEERWIRTLFKA